MSEEQGQYIIDGNDRDIEDGEFACHWCHKKNEIIAAQREEIERLRHLLELNRLESDGEEYDDESGFGYNGAPL